MSESKKKSRNVLIVGSGGREHALCWKICQSSFVQNVYVAPGNGGTFFHNVSIGSDDIFALRDFAKSHECLTIVGPEAPLAQGIVDVFQKDNLPIFGPTREQARLETSKAYAKDFMKRNSIPSPDFRIFENAEEAIDFAHRKQGEVVVKADGLASGKGVFVCDSTDEAEAAIRTILTERSFGSAGDRVVIEEKLVGHELSLIAICDGRKALPFGTAVDHKRALDGNKGPNTGGMGAFSPAPGMDNHATNEMTRSIILPAVEKSGFRGFLYAGLMISSDEKKPMVLEFNARLGDPETEVILPRLESDLLLLTDSVSHGESVMNLNISWKTNVCTAVVMCAEGYPRKPRIGDRIHGIDKAELFPNVLIFHSGTSKSDSEFVTQSGRVLCVAGEGDDYPTATQRAYEAANAISWRGEHHRKDICSLSAS